MQILCTHDYGDIHEGEIYNKDSLGFLANSFDGKDIEDSNAYNKYPEYFIEILPDIDIGKSELEIKVSALCRRHTKLLKEKGDIDKEIDKILALIYKFEELGKDHF